MVSASGPSALMPRAGTTSGTTLGFPYPIAVADGGVVYLAIEGSDSVIALNDYGDPLRRHTSVADGVT